MTDNNKDLSILGFNITKEKKEQVLKKLSNNASFMEKLKKFNPRRKIYQHLKLEARDIKKKLKAHNQKQNIINYDFHYQEGMGLRKKLFEIQEQQSKYETFPKPL